MRVYPAVAVCFFAAVAWTILLAPPPLFNVLLREPPEGCFLPTVRVL